MNLDQWNNLSDEEKNKLIAESRGIIPCDDWHVSNLGSVGGPCLIGDCKHEPGTCYSTKQIPAPFGNKLIGGPPNYLGDMDLCMDLVKELQRQRIYTTLENFGLPDEGFYDWKASLDKFKNNRYEIIIIEMGNTPQEAICTAYAKAVGIVEE